MDLLDRLFYRDLVLGPVVFPGKEGQLFHTAEMARLKEIKQLGAAYLFHETATHTRFHHSAGVAWRARFFIDTLPYEEYEALSLDDKFLLTAAAALHDIGHAAWSHIGERFVEYLGRNVSHDERSAALICDTDGKYDKYFTPWSPLPRVHTLFEEDEREKLAQLVSGAPPFSRSDDEATRRDVELSKGWMGQLIHGQLDLDRADFLTRDAFFTLTTAQLLVDPVTAAEKTGLFAVKPDSKKELGFLDLPFAESFLVGRDLMYEAVYLEPRKMVAEELLVRAFLRIFRNDDPDSFWFSTDDQLMYQLTESGDELAQRVCSLMRRRATYDVVCQLSFGELASAERGNLSFLSSEPKFLLRFEQEVVEHLGSEFLDRFVLAISVWPRPKKIAGVWIKRPNHEPELLGEVSRLIQTLLQQEYAEQRSKLIIAVDPGLEDSNRMKLTHEIRRQLLTRDLEAEYRAQHEVQRRS